VIQVFPTTPFAFADVLLNNYIARKLAVRKSANLLIGRALTSVRCRRFVGYGKIVLLAVAGYAACHSLVFSQMGFSGPAQRALMIPTEALDQKACIIKNKKREQHG
jgi:hypothetical protein